MRGNLMPITGRKKKTEQIVFGGYTHTVNAPEGSIWDEQNISARAFPYLRPVKARAKSLPNATNAIFSHNGLGQVNGTQLWYDGHYVGEVQDNEKQIAVMGNQIVIWPDKVILNASYKRLGTYPTLAALQQAVKDPKEFDAYGVGSNAPYELYAWNGKAWKSYGPELEPMERSFTASNVAFKNGTYQGVPVKANTLEFSQNVENLGFQPGDAVSITGCTIHPENNKTAIIREIDGKQLRFYEFAFLLDNDSQEMPQPIKDYTEPGPITLARTVPDLDLICASENRLWGAKGDTIYASKQGDARNFNVFDGLTTDSWFQTTGTAGSFSGCVTFLGQPVFFKPEFIFKIFGANAENFYPSRTATMGVKDGARKSLAIAGEVLYYLSDQGLCSYSGGVPRTEAIPFGTVHYQTAVAGSDGRRLYLSMERETGEQENFCLDTATNMLTKEDSTKVRMFCRFEAKLYGLYAAGGGYTFNKDDGASQNAWVQFADFTDGTMDRKSIIRLQMRVMLEQGARLEVYVQYDSDGVWRHCKTLEATRKRSFLYPIRVDRCDHWSLKLVGTGYWELQQMAKVFAVGSGVH